MFQNDPLVIQIDHAIPNPLLESHLSVMVLGSIGIPVTDYSSTDQTQ